MRFRKERDQLSWHYHRQWSNTNGPKETQRCCRLARPPQPNRNPQIPWVYQLLLIFCPRVFENSTPTIRSHKKGCCMALGRTTTQSIQRTQDSHVLPPCPHATRLQ